MKYCILFILMGGGNNNLDTTLKSEFKSVRSSNVQNSTKQNAYMMLRNKCTTCHTTKKRLYIFTWDNVDSLSKVINKKVL